MCRYLGCLFCVLAVVLAVSGPAQASTLTPYGQAVVADNPVVYWPMTETSGTTAYNAAAGSNSAGSAGNGLYGAAPRTSPSLTTPFTGTWPTGVVPGELVSSVGGLAKGTYDFSNTASTGTYMPSGLIPNLEPGQGAYSVEMWFAQNDSTPPGYLFNWQTNNSNGALQIFYRNSSDLRIYFQPTNDGTKTARIDTTGFNFTANTMYDLAVTYTPGTYVVNGTTLYGTFAVYINGVKQTLSGTINNGTASASILGPAAQPNISGTNWEYGPPCFSLDDNSAALTNNGGSNNDTIGQFGFYNYALSSAQVANHFAAAQQQIPTPEPGTLALLAAGLAGLLCYAWRKRK